jgi:hypothetical protein
MSDFWVYIESFAALKYSVGETPSLQEIFESAMHVYYAHLEERLEKREKTAQEELDDINLWLAELEPVAGGGTTLEQIQNVIRHYATQMGRWHKENK